jgi:hypothetical protein
MATSRAGRLSLALTVAFGLGTSACASGAAAPGAPRAVAAGPPSAQALQAVTGAAAGALSRTAGVAMTLSRGALFGAPSSPVDASGTFDFGSLRGSLSFVPSGSRTSEPVVFTPTAVYVRPPAGGSPLPQGKSWTVADFSDPEALTSNFPRLIAQAESVNPALILSELLWGASAAAPAGSDVVRGRSAAGYAVTVDLTRALGAVAGPAQVPFSRAIASQVVALHGALDGSGPHVTLAVRVWVADTGQLARISLSPPGAGVGGLTITLAGFGAAVHADPPPPAQVVDVLTLAPGGERENSNGGDSDGG